MNDHIAMLRSMANARLGLQPTLPTAEQIREVLTRLRTSDVLPVPVTDNEAEELARELEVNFGILMPIGSVLTERDYEPWLEGARGSFEPDYWNRYRHYLSNDREGSRASGEPDKRGRMGTERLGRRPCPIWQNRALYRADQ